jgi:hypothetical protein
MARRASNEVLIEWNQIEVERFLHDPNGELGRGLMAKLGEVVLAGAKRRALRRTGRMANEMFFKVDTDARGVYTDIISPAQNEKSGFHYPLMHERKKVRDRRPHRSLRPALADIRKILTRD